jgi:hypothetical protein
MVVQQQDQECKSSAKEEHTGADISSIKFLSEVLSSPVLDVTNLNFNFKL